MMWMVTAVRIGMVIFGVLFMLLDLYLYVHKKMYEPIMFTWAVIAVLGIILGIARRPWGYVGEPGAPVVLVISLVLVPILLAMLVFSSIISIHIYKNQEIAMQVSLLNEEMETIRKRMSNVEKTIGVEEDESDRNVLAELIAKILEEESDEKES